MQPNKALIEKYNIAGPRYTSYPTAMEFTDDYSANDFIQALSCKTKDLLSLYLHIPFCRNICYYCACNKVITKDSSKADQYLDYLVKEAKIIAKNASSNKIGQIHFGGGTPTFLSDSQIKWLMTELSELFVISCDAEISIEIDPRTVDATRIKKFKPLGFNRLSIGVQDFNHKVQSAVNREHSFEQVQSIIEAVRQEKYESINIDLIYGLPHQTTETFKQTIEQLETIKPERIALYNYAHLPHRFKPQRRINAEDLPSAEQKLAIFQQAQQQLIAAGYVYIGMDHFALPNDSLSIAQSKGELHRNFQGYTTHKDYQLVGIGVSSISKINGCYSQNYTNLSEYYKSLDNGVLPVWRGCKLSKDDEIRHQVIMELICNFNLDIKALEKQYAITFSHYFSDEIKQLQIFVDDQLVNMNEQALTVTQSGRFFIRNICMNFDRYLQELSQLNLYSKVI